MYPFMVFGLPKLNFAEFIEVKVSASSDDAEESDNRGLVDLIITDLELVYDAYQDRGDQRGLHGLSFRHFRE
jgi:hypothetical protein